MAIIQNTNETTVLRIREFLGLNENPDGDTTLKNGEMSEMRNFCITQDRHLQIREGSKTICDLYEQLADVMGEDVPPRTETRLNGVWKGTINEQEHIIVGYHGYIWDVTINEVTFSSETRLIGNTINEDCHFFGFDNKVYMLNGTDYLCWNGNSETTFENVIGYIPIVKTACNPAGSGTDLEAVNRLNGKRRVQFSPDGTSKEFVLPETNITSVDKITVSDVEIDNYTADLENGKVTLAVAPIASTNTMEVTYTKGVGRREEVLTMRFSELYNGSTDTRVFLYGNGTNKTIYSGIPYDTGKPSAEYFPDLYEVNVGESNTPITALVRHFSRLMVYKPNSAWVIQYGTISLEDNSTTAAFYVQPINRQFGNEALGQVKLLENNPITLDAKSVYQWKSNNQYNSTISSNENNAKRLSAKVNETLNRFDFDLIKTFNIKSEHEYWFMQGNNALIFNYGNDTWYYYDNLPYVALVDTEKHKFGFGDDGRIVHISREYRNDDGNAINCYAASGAMDFGKDWMLKYSPMIFVAMQPESNARIEVTIETNRRSDYPTKVVAYNLATAVHVDFNHFSFATNRKPQVKRVKVKVKKATFYRLIFKSNSASATATIIETDINLRFAGNVK